VKPSIGSLVLVPCYNEEHTIARVVADFRAVLPEAAVYVYDNNSSDSTIEVAQRAGAVVRRETRQGKGHVVRRMFNDVEADLYVLVDGDATYDAPSASP
jgi:glycosyltransferase involved in cell wall biosynthesis